MFLDIVLGLTAMFFISFWLLMLFSAVSDSLDRHKARKLIIHNECKDVFCSNCKQKFGK